MESTTTQTFDLSDGDVKEAIADFIEKKFGKGKPVTVTIHAGTRLEGYGMNEQQVAYASISARREA